MFDKGFDYVGSLFEDDIFIRRDLNTPERYPIKIVKMIFLSQVWHHCRPSKTYGGDRKFLYFVRPEARINS